LGGLSLLIISAGIGEENENLTFEVENDVIKQIFKDLRVLQIGA
jgi:hypothetical protein